MPSLSRGNMTISALSRPASQIGGDLYDFAEPADGLLGLLVGDVSGKGISAALFMAKVISEFRFHARGVTSPGTVLSALNASLAGAPRGMFVTALYVIADTKSGMLQIACAGHPPAVFMNESGCRTIDVPSGPPIGIMDFAYPSTPLPFAAGNRLLVVTDGVFDAKNPVGERWGFDAMLTVINKHATSPNLMKVILDHVDAFADSAPQADDTTIAEIRIDGTTQAE
jgi:sigma-B regulation protein RsbU (phosphoserine phosphatase)